MSSTLNYRSNNFVAAVEGLVKEACVEESDAYIEISQENLDELKVLTPILPQMKKSFEQRMNVCIQNLVDTRSATNEVNKELNEVRTITDEIIKITRSRDDSSPIQLGEQNQVEFQRLKQDSKYFSQSMEEKLDKCHKYISDTREDMASIKSNTCDMVVSANKFVRAETFVRAQREEDNATATRLGQKNLSLLKGLILDSRSLKHTFDGKWNICNQEMSDIKEDVNEIVGVIRNVKSATGELVHEALLEHDAKSLQLAKDHIEEVDKFSTNLNKVKESFDAMLEACNQNMTDTGKKINGMTQGIENAKKSMEELAARIPQSEKGIPAKHAQRQEDFNKLATCMTDTKKLLNRNYDGFHTHMKKMKVGVYNLAQDMHNMKEVADELAKVLFVGQGVNSIILGEQNLEEMQKNLCLSKSTKVFTDKMLDECTKNTIEAKNDFSETKKCIKEVKTHTLSLLDMAKCKEENFSTQDHEIKVDELKKTCSNSTIMKKAFNDKMNVCNETMEVVKKMLPEMKKGINNVNKAIDNLALVAANNDVILNCNKICEQNIKEVGKLADSSTAMKKSLDDKIDIYNTNMNNAMKNIDDVITVTQELLKVTRAGKSFKSIGLGKQSLEVINKLSTNSTLMRDSFDSKLVLCHQQVGSVKEDIGHVNDSIMDVSKIIEEFVTVNTSGDGRRSIRFGQDNFDELSKLSVSISRMKEIIDGKIDVYNENMTDAKEQINTMNNEIVCAKKEVSEVRKDLDEVKNSLLKITINLQRQNKKQRVEWALSNITTLVENFQFKRLSAPTSPSKNLTDSHVLIKRVLMAFREGAGLYFPVDAVKADENLTDEIDEEEKKKEFRDKIINQITRLTGFKPVITKKDDGKISIFSS